jgi:hypothetical protein
MKEQPRRRYIGSAVRVSSVTGLLHVTTHNTSTWKGVERLMKRLHRMEVS